MPRAPLLHLSIGLLLAGGPLAGCITNEDVRSTLGGYVGDQPADTCIRHARAHWIEPGLFAQLAAALSTRDVFVKLTTPPDHLDVRFPSVENALGPAALQAVFVLLQGNERMGLMWTQSVEKVELIFDDRITTERAVELFDKLLRVGGLADAPQRPHWEAKVRALDDLNTNVFVLDGARVDPHAMRDRILQDGALAIEPGGLGEARARNDAWELRFRTQVVEVVGNFAASDAIIGVDPADRVNVETTLNATELEWPGIQQRVNLTFEKLGIAPPIYRDATGGSGVTCNARPTLL